MARESKPDVGIRLRSFRERQNWSLRELAERCGLSINAISRIERGENSPTVSSLQRLASALSIPITEFFEAATYKTTIFVPSGLGRSTQEDGYWVQHLGAGLHNQKMEPILMVISEGSESGARPIHHPGEEFVYCLSGELEYRVGDDVFLLKPGDSLIFEATQYHSWHNCHSEPATVLLILQSIHDLALARQCHHAG
jgi:transcriptional regulator with XRE-family HTH domain